MTDAIAGIASIAMNPEIDVARQPAVSTTDFGRALGEGLKTLNTNLNASDEVLRRVAAGEHIPLYDAMIVMSRAQMDLQFAVELRNRLVASYQQLTQMQI